MAVDDAGEPPHLPGRMVVAALGGAAALLAVLAAVLLLSGSSAEPLALRAADAALPRLPLSGTAADGTGPGDATGPLEATGPAEVSDPAGTPGAPIDPPAAAAQDGAPVAGADGTADGATGTPATPGPPAGGDATGFAGAEVAAASPAFPSRIRGVWVHVLDDTVLTRAGIETMLDTVVAGGGNTIVIEVARRHDAYYDSALLPRANDPGFEPGLDVLAATVEGARARGLSVHAWFTAMPAWTPDTAKDGSVLNWTYAQHGPDAAPADTWHTFDAAGAPSDFLDPGHPEVQDLVVATAAELAAYDVDAVHLDYLRYPGPQHGYNPTALGRFQAETGRTDIPAPDDPQWADWRRAQTTQILRRVDAAVAEVDPSVGISAALIAWGDGPVGGRTFEQTPAFGSVFQPWPSWMAEGLIDVAMPMLYFRESRHAAYHRNWMAYVAAVRAETGVLTAPGHGSWLNSPPESLAQLGDAAPLVDGEVLFSYQETGQGQGPEALLGGALAGGLWSG